MVELEALAELMERWRLKLRSPVFVDDGPVDAKAYAQAPKRIVFVLKEPNIKPRDSLPRWSLGEFAAEGERAPTWNMLSYWATGLLAVANPEWAKLPVADRGFRQQALRQVAVMNLNKAGGGASTRMSVLLEQARGVPEEIRAELRLLRPHLIVACGTGDVLADVALTGAPEWLEESTSGAVKLWTLHHTALPAPLLAAPHPAARKSGEAMYTSVVSVGRRLLSEQLGPPPSSRGG